MMNDPSRQEFTVGQIKGFEVFKEAWALVKPDFWMVWAVTFLGMVIAGLIPIVIMGPMICGIYLCLFDKIDGKPIDLGRLFKGFDLFGPSLLIAVVIFVPILIFLAVVYVPIVLTALVAGSNRISQGEMMAMISGMIVTELIFAVIMVIIHSFLIFAFQLVADRRMSGWAAIKLSARAAWANKGGVAGLIGVSFLVVLLGYAMCIVGVYFVLPVIIMANAIAFRRVFPKTAETQFAPPPPSAYSNL